MIERGVELPVVRQAKLLGVSRSSVYYTPRALPERDLRLMRRIDELHLELPFYGARKLADQLRREGHRVGRRHVATLMRRMGIEAQYRRPRTSLPARGAAIYPYLLAGLAIERPNQVWASDITYLPMAHGFLYLAAILDVASRKVLAFRLSNTLTADFCVEALEEALAKYGRPAIFNTDQGAQFTSDECIKTLTNAGVAISMDGKGRWIGRVDDWRGKHTSRGVAVSGGAGASVRFMGPVSSRRSSNRTCRFPASGSHARVSGLRLRHGRPTVGELVEAERLVEILVRVLAVPAASLPLSSDQPSLQTASGVFLDDPVRPDHSTLIEIAGPTAQQRVQRSHSFLGRFQIPPWRRLVMDSLDDALERFARRLRADKGTAVLAVEPPNRIPEKVERLFGYTREPSLPVIDRQPQPFHQPPHFREGGRAVAGTTADHEIIGIVDDVRIKPRTVAIAVPRQEKASEVEVRKKRRCRSSLRGASLPVTSFCRAGQPSSTSPLTHRCREPLFEHRQHRAIGHPTSDTLRQRTMRDCREVVG